MPRAVITGAGGLVGSECVDLLAGLGWEIIGIDNNLRAELFGPAGSVAPRIERLRLKYPSYRHHALDIRDRKSMRVLLRDETPDLIIHTAARRRTTRPATFPMTISTSTRSAL